MKLSTRYGIFVAAAVFCAAAFTFLSSKASAQDDGWQIMRAEYGTRAQHNDVTDVLKDLISRGGVNGRVAVSNQTMGGDPAVGADKHLRIWARNRRNEEREFDYKEGAFIEAGMFVMRRDDHRDDRRDDLNDRPAYSGGQYQQNQDDPNSVRIIRAYYGVQGRTVNVTDFLRNRVNNGTLTFVVANSALGGDPAPGADKVLIVVYRFQGTETATAVREGNTLSLP
jgi:hypothetical protein